MDLHTRLSTLVLILLTLGCRADAQPAREPGSVLQERVRIALPGVEGRIDHLAYDAANQRLYVAALGNDTVEVIDLKQSRRVAEIRGIKKPQGVWVVPESGTLVVASGEDGRCRFYDSRQKLLATIDNLDDADNVRYDEKEKLIYIGYGEGALAVIDAVKMSKVADIPLGAHPESFRLEEKGERIFINLPDKKEIAVVDRRRRAVVARWALKESQQNFPMFLDEGSHRLLVGCRRPATLLVMDTESGAVVASLPCCGDTDDVFFDPSTRRIYLSGGEGCVWVGEQISANEYRALGKRVTAAGARTSLYVSEKRTVYVAVPRRGGQEAAIVGLSDRKD